jgi:hypothetical protein
VTGSIDRSNPASNQNVNTAVLLQGLLKGARGDYGTQLEVNKIPQGLPPSDFRVSDLNPSAIQKVNSSETCRVKH